MTKQAQLKAIAVMIALAGAACGNKASPKSTTTTRTQSTTTTDTGDNSTSDVKETTVKQPDGSSNVTRTETTNTSAPAAPPK
jgi:hypothetical protein